MDLTVSAGNGAAALAWLKCALEHARKQGQERLVGYLEAVLDDVVFEIGSAVRS